MTEIIFRAAVALKSHNYCSFYRYNDTLHYVSPANSAYLNIPGTLSMKGTKEWWLQPRKVVSQCGPVLKFKWRKCPVVPLIVSHPRSLWSTHLKMLPTLSIFSQFSLYPFEYCLPSLHSLHLISFLPSLLLLCSSFPPFPPLLWQAASDSGTVDTHTHTHTCTHAHTHTHTRIYVAADKDTNQQERGDRSRQ